MKQDKHPVFGIKLMDEITQTKKRAGLIMKLRGQGIQNKDVLTAIERIPREYFIPDAFKEQAYRDIALPVEYGETIPDPYTIALICEQLNLTADHRVLLVGTGSGYMTAIISQLCRRIYSVENNRKTLVLAENRFLDLKLENIATRHGDGLQGWPEHAPFDRIVVTGSLPFVPDTLVAQLITSLGEMILPVGKNRTDQYLVQVLRAKQTYHTRLIANARFMHLNITP